MPSCHSYNTKPVHRPKDSIVSYECSQEVQSTQPFVKHSPSHLWIPIVNRREESEDCTSYQYVVEVGYYEVCLVEVSVHGD